MFSTLAPTWAYYGGTPLCNELHITAQGLNQQEVIYLLFWRLEGQGEGAGTVGLSPAHLLTSVCTPPPRAS